MPACCCFSRSELVANPRKLLYYAVTNLARGLLNMENMTKTSSLAAFPPHAARTTKITKRVDDLRGHHVTHLHACQGATKVSVRLASVQDPLDSSTRQIGVASQVIRFRVR